MLIFSCINFVIKIYLGFKFNSGQQLFVLMASCFFFLVPAEKLISSILSETKYYGLGEHLDRYSNSPSCVSMMCGQIELTVACS